MNIEEARKVSHLLEKLGDHDRLYEDIREREVDFVEGNRVRSLGRMQMDEREITELQAKLRVWVNDWFSARRKTILVKLQELGVATLDKNGDAI